MLESTLSYATTPLALASLVIIAGIGILKLIVAGKNNALNRLITHYGFAIVIIFGVLGNAAYLYSAYQTSEMIIIGTVVDDNGHYLPNALIDAEGRARGMSLSAGEFVMAIPASRVADQYEITAVLEGYEKVTKKIKNSSRMFVRFELPIKKGKLADAISLADREIFVGHYMGLPDVYLALAVENKGPSMLKVGNFSVVLSSPSGKTRNLVHANSAATMNSPFGQPLQEVQVKVGDRFSWANGFVQYDNEVQQLSASALQALNSSQEFRQSGPRVGQQVLLPDLTSAIKQMLLKNWFWEAGVSTIRITCNASGNRFEMIRTITLTKAQIDAMQRSSDYYSAGYGLIFGSELMPVGAAQPGLKVVAEGV